MTNKTNHFSKVISIIAFVLTIVILIVATCFSIYYGGQKKTVTNFFTSIQRQDIEMFNSNVVALQNEVDVYTEYNEKWYNEFGEDYKVRCDFVTRKSSNEYVINLIVYNDTSYSKTENLVVNLKRESGKWKINLLQKPYIQ